MLYLLSSFYFIKFFDHFFIGSLSTKEHRWAFVVYLVTLAKRQVERIRWAHEHAGLAGLKGTQRGNTETAPT